MLDIRESLWNILMDGVSCVCKSVSATGTFLRQRRLCITLSPTSSVSVLFNFFSLQQRKKENDVHRCYNISDNIRENNLHRRRSIKFSVTG